MIAGLPYDAEVEYLESTGTQYIDTGYYPNGTNFGYKFDLLFYNDLSGTRSIAGCWGPQYIRNGWCFSVGGNYLNRFGGSNFNWRGSWELSSRINVGVRSTIVVKNLGYSESDNAYLIKVESPLVNETLLYNDVYVGTPTNTFALFGIRYNGLQVIGEIAHCRIYEAVLYENDTVVMHFVPVRFTNEQGVSEGAMYDRVSRKLFRNAGTGSFTIGPDVATPVMGLHFFKSQIKTAKDYVQNGLIAMWDGIENVGYGQHDDNATSWADLTGKGANWLLKDSNTTQVFEVGSDYVKILSDVSYNGRGHCTPSWSSGSDITTVEMVIDNTGFDIIGDMMARIVSFGVGNGNFDQTIHIKGLLFAPNIYNKYGQVSLATGLNSVSLEIGSQPVLVNGTFVQSENRTFSGYTYSAPVLGAYAATAAVGLKIKSLRAYVRSLTDTERLANYAVDRVRFNLPSSS